jgi:hypothetical protein
VTEKQTIQADNRRAKYIQENQQNTILEKEQKEKNKQHAGMAYWTELTFKTEEKEFYW